jgi:uncharacterized protein YbjT (DUF2867 family)
MVADRILVVGGTGLLGGPVARQLLADGFAVRLLVRDQQQARSRLGPHFEYSEGDIGDAAAVQRAVRGCAGVHISLGAHGSAKKIDRVEHRGTARLAEAAARHGIGRLSYLTGALVHEPYGDKIPEHRAKLLAEEAINRSGVPYVYFRPTYFMDNLPRHIQGKVAVVLGRRQLPLHMVAASDFAPMVARAFRAPEAANREFIVHGPEAITIPRALGLYCARVEPGTRVVTVPLGVMGIVDRLFMGGQLQASLQLMRLLQRLGERGNPTETTSLLGEATTTVAEWCERQASNGETRSYADGNQSRYPNR